MHTYPKTHLKLALLLAAVFCLAVTALPERSEPEMARVPVSLSIAPTDVAITPATIPAEPVEQATEAPETAELQDLPVAVTQTRVKIKSGDSLSAIFSRAGLSAATLQRVMEADGPVDVLKRIIPGKQLVFRIDADNELVSLSYVQSPLKQLTVDRRNDGFQAAWQEAETETIISFRSAEINEKQPSLYMAGKTAGLSDTLIMNLSQIFQWDISFALDLRNGDDFTLLYEDIYVDGEKVKEGRILAAQFNNAGEVHKAVLYTDAEGVDNYYAPDGTSLRKAFLRDPVHFSHVSSRFNMRRLHPVHKTVMPHRGIDYAAATGTPVRASGDGRVTTRTRNSASGNFLVVQHGEQYTTKYLHLSGFAKGIQAGSRVKQGQVIGYVGATGWATGPHLHYEFLVNGVHRNPKTVTLPQAAPVAPEELDRFRTTTSTMLARLDSISGVSNLAMAGGN